MVKPSKHQGEVALQAAEISIPEGSYFHTRDSTIAQACVELHPLQDIDLYLHLGCKDKDTITADLPLLAKSAFLFIDQADISSSHFGTYTVVEQRMRLVDIAYPQPAMAEVGPGMVIASPLTTTLSWLVLFNP